jgi:hypothetical protein
MKAMVVTVIAAAVICLDVSAARAQTVSGGFEGGLPATWIDTSGQYETHSSPGAAFGGFVTFAVSPSIRIQPELLVVANRLTTNLSSLTGHVSFTSVEFPVLVRAAVAKSGRSAFVLLGGVQPAYMGTVRQKLEGIEMELSEEIKNFNLSLVFGGGLEFSAGPGALTVDVRTSIGVRELSTDTNFLSAKSRSIAVLAGYRFR